jgi:hypothetical protein
MADKLMIILFLVLFTVICFKLGEETDEHGCKITAGYSWCESKQKCIRSFEEDCPELLIGRDQDDVDDVLILDSPECGEFLDICSPGDKEKP